MKSQNIYSLRFFSVPLYNNYENVYDTDFMNFYNYNSSNELISDTLVFELNGLDRAIPLNRETFITLDITYIPAEKLQDITKITYCVVENYFNKFYYYFVTDYTTSNNSMSITFNLEWDVWQNNLDMLNAYLNPQQVSRCTRNDGKLHPLIGTAGYISPSDGLISFNQVEAVPIERDLVTGAKEILYMRILFDADFELKLAEGEVDKHYNASSFFSPLRIGYIPFCCINRDGTPDLSIQFYAIQNSNGVYSNMPIGFIKDDLLTNLFTNIVSIDFTFSSPFNTEYNQGSTSIKITDEVYSYNGIIFNIVNRSYIYNLEKHKRIIDVLDEVNKVGDLSLYRDYNDYNLNGAMLKYPYNFKTLNFNGREEVLTTSKDKTKNIISIIIDNNINYSLSYVNDDDNLNISQIPLMGEKNGVINRDSLSEYMRNNKNTDLTNLVITSVENSVKYLQSGITGDFAGMGSGIWDEIKYLARYNAKLMDIKNSRDASIIPTNDPTSIIYQNTLPYIKTYKVTSGEVLQNEHRMIALYGVESNEIVDIFYVNRLYYDYFVIPNPILNNIHICNEDKLVLSNILSKGIRIWHTSLVGYTYLQKEVKDIFDMSNIWLMNFRYFNYNRDLWSYIKE